jgi:hypothetical protein
MDAVPRTLSLPSSVRQLILWVTPLLTVFGFLFHSTWRNVAVFTVVDYALIAAAITTIAGLVWMVQRRRFVATAAGAWLVALACFAGLGPTAAALVIAAVALGLGTLLVADDEPAPAELALLAGLGIICAAVGWLLPFPIHRPWVYLLVAALVISLRRRAIVSAVRPLGSRFVSAIDQAPVAAFVAITCVGIASTAAWLPTAQSDDVSYHLALPWQLQELGYYRMAAGDSLWAVAPWASDVVHAIAQLLAGSEARGAVNGVWLLLICGTLWQLGLLLGLPSALRWMAIALYVTFPMSSSLLAGMQTETATTATLLGLAIAIGRPAVYGRKRLCLIAVLAGLLLALKLSNALLLIPMGVWLVARAGRGLPWKWLLPASALGLLVAASSYFYAYLLTGNPTLPFLNGIFQSPYFQPINWKDELWNAGVNWRTPWDLTFHTTRYLSAKDGASGMALLLIFAGTLLALLRRRARALALVGLGCFLLVFFQIQYVRYVHPSFALLVPVAMAGLNQLELRRQTLAAVGAIVVLNLSLLSTGYWQIHGGMLHVFLLEGSREALRKFVPQREVAARVRDLYHGSKQALFHNVISHGNAELAGTAYTTAWYDWRLRGLAAAADSDPTGKAWRKLLSDFGVEVVVVDTQRPSPALSAALRSSESRQVSSVGNYEIWEIAGISLPAATTVEKPEYIKVRYPVSGDVRRFDSSISMHCDQVNVPIIVSWSARYADRPGETHLESRWATCTTSEVASIENALTLNEPVKEFVVTASPTKPMRFSLIRAATIPASDVARDRDLASGLRQSIASLFVRKQQDGNAHE